MELVDHPSKVEMIPGQPWVKRLKYVTVAELLADYEASNASIGRTFCPVESYFREHLNDPLEEVETYVYSHPEWGPTTLCETMYKTIEFQADHPHREFQIAWVQHFCALELVKHPFERARHPLSEMLKHPDMRFVSKDAGLIVLDYLVKNHPNPRKFLEKPEVSLKFPGLDITQYRAPDFERA